MKRARLKSQARQREIDEAVLSVKELLRQHQGLGHRLGDQALNDFDACQPFQDMQKAYENLRDGRITGEEFEREMTRIDELVSREMRATNDPEALTTLDADNEAKAKGLSGVAQMLLMDAVRSAANGASKEQWIAEVLAGHCNDETAQLGCLRHIVALWSDGPWPWPRMTEKADEGS